MGFIEYLAKQALKKEIKKGSKRVVDNMIKTAKNNKPAVESSSNKKSVSSQPSKDIGLDHDEIKKAIGEGKITHSKGDFALYDVVLPSIASIARLLGMSVGSFISSIAATQAAKSKLTPDNKKAKYGTTFHDSAAAMAAPVTAAIGKIAGMTGKEVAGVIENAATQGKLNKDMEIFANREALGLPNTGGMYQYLNGTQSRAYDNMKSSRSKLDDDEDPSDENLKEIDFEKAVDLCSKAGKFGDKDIFNDDEEYDDSVLDGYAEYIKNYAYNYKDEAKELDPDIDTEQEHIGPMAQDIEKVNPACVVEKDGYKAVDTGRLALMNAGAIGDLARDIKQIKEKLNV